MPVTQTFRSGSTSGNLTSRRIRGEIAEALEGASQDGWQFVLSHYNPNSDQPSEEYALADMAPTMRQWANGRRAKMLSAQTITIENVAFEASIQDYRTNWQQDKTGLMASRVSELVGRGRQHWRRLLTDLMELGSATSIYDGSNFFATDHESGDSGSQRNLLAAGTDPTMNVSDPDVPTATEMADLITVAVNHFYSLKDNEGEPVNEDANRFLVMVPQKYANPARLAVSANLLNPGTGTVDNPLSRQPFSIDIEVNARLDNTASASGRRLYVYRTDALSARPFILQQDGMERISDKSEGSEFEHDHDMWEFGISANRNAGFGNWKQAVECQLS